MGITEFVTARLDEDEAEAKAAAARVGTDTWQLEESDDGRDVISMGSYGFGAHAALGGHIALHDPARVLREVEAKRAILAAYLNERQNGFAGSGYCEGLEEAVKIIAAIWSDHEDYRQERR